MLLHFSTCPQMKIDLVVGVRGGVDHKVFSKGSNSWSESPKYKELPGRDGGGNSVYEVEGTAYGKALRHEWKILVLGLVINLLWLGQTMERN